MSTQKVIWVYWMLAKLFHVMWTVPEKKKLKPVWLQHINVNKNNSYSFLLIIYDVEWKQTLWLIFTLPNDEKWMWTKRGREIERAENILLQFLSKIFSGFLVSFGTSYTKRMTFFQTKQEKKNVFLTRNTKFLLWNSVWRQ